MLGCYLKKKKAFKNEFRVFNEILKLILQFKAEGTLFLQITRYGCFIVLFSVEEMI